MNQESKLILEAMIKQNDREDFDYIIGNSRFSDDIWDLSGLESSNGTGKSKLQIRFNQISKIDIKNVVKRYMSLCL